MKIRHTLSLALLSSATLAYAGPVGDGGKAVVFDEPAPIANPFDRAISPVTSPTLFDLAVPRSQIRPLFIYHKFPNSVRTTLGDLPVGGDLEVYALQLEIAINERWSIVASKDGYIDHNPDATLTKTDGWANLSAGLKYAFIYRPEDAFAAALNLQIEVPTGTRSVWQGEGDGVAIPAISVLKMWDRLQFAGNLGFKLPFDTNAESTMFHTNAHLSYAVTDKFIPLLEVNWYRALKSGDGGKRFDDQVGGAVPAVIEFEGGDLVNFGAANALANKDIVTLGAGFRYRFTDNIDVGAAYEIPLTTEEESLYDSRVTVDMSIRF